MPDPLPGTQRAMLEHLITPARLWI